MDILDPVYHESDKFHQRGSKSKKKGDRGNKAIIQSTCHAIQCPIVYQISMNQKVTE